MSKKIFILTESFPLGAGEAFLETEDDYLPSDVEAYYCPLCLDLELKNRDIERYSNTIIINPKDISLPIRIAGFVSLFSKSSIKEVISLAAKGKLNHKNIYKLCSLMYNSTIKTKALSVKIRKLINQNDHLVFYAYWLYLEALCSVKLKSHFQDNSLALSRAHGFDIYEERSNGYLPYREYLLQNVDFVFPISQDGCNYLSEKYPAFKGKISLSRLGTKDYGVTEWTKCEGKLRIVSCSYCSPVKRLFLLADSLASASESISGIEWTHLGGGPLYEELKAYCANNLRGKISYDLRGNMSNKEIIDVYKHEQFDLFVNVSESEGIPVSIMEAMSFGIPILATDVGGTSEIVENGISGYLLKKDFTESEFVSKIDCFDKMPQSIFMDFRCNVRNQWENAYNAEMNYKLFYTNMIRYE